VRTDTNLVRVGRTRGGTSHLVPNRFPCLSRFYPQNTVSAMHEAVEFRGGHRRIDIAEGALFLDLAGGVEEAAHGRPVERGGEADPLHPGGREIPDRERATFDPGHKVNGRESAVHTDRTAARSGRPGAISTSAPAASKACRRLIVSSKSGLPRRKFSARAVS